VRGKREKAKVDNIDEESLQEYGMLEKEIKQSDFEGWDSK